MQLWNRWAASSRGLSSWGGWIWRSLSAGHELAVYQTKTAAHLVWSQGSSWYFPAVCIVGNNSHIFTFFSSRRLLANSWNGLSGMVTRILWIFSNHANGGFSGMGGKEAERWCYPGFLAEERENNLLKSPSKFGPEDSKDLRNPWPCTCTSGFHPAFSFLAFYNQTQCVTQGVPSMFKPLQNMLAQSPDHSKSQCEPCSSTRARLCDRPSCCVHKARCLRMETGLCLAHGLFQAQRSPCCVGGSELL